MKDAIQLLQEEYGTVRLVVAFNEPHGIVAKYMNACDAIVLASDHEGAPMAIREAMACGLPVVSVDVGDVRDTIGEVEGCYLCRQEAEDLAEEAGLDSLSTKKNTQGWGRQGPECSPGSRASVLGLQSYPQQEPG